eukprot:scaffold56436_cov100-Phaeocystis_antarctica.AAC.1
MDDMCACSGAAWRTRAQGRGGSDCGSSLAGRTREDMLLCRPDSMREVAACYGRAWGGRTCPAAFVIVGAPFQAKHM